jgi:hypothetical protein
MAPSPAPHKPCEPSCLEIATNLPLEQDYSQGMSIPPTQVADNMQWSGPGSQSKLLWLILDTLSRVAPLRISMPWKPAMINYKKEDKADKKDPKRYTAQGISIILDIEPPSQADALAPFWYVAKQHDWDNVTLWLHCTR